MNEKKDLWYEKKISKLYYWARQIKGQHLKMKYCRLQIKIMWRCRENLIEEKLNVEKKQKLKNAKTEIKNSLIEQDKVFT